MSLLNVISVPTANGIKTIEIHNDDLTKLNWTFDILVISAYHNKYKPAPNTLIKALEDNSGIVLENLAEKPLIDLRESLNCWISELIEGENFKHVLCIEGIKTAIESKGSSETPISDLFGFISMSQCIIYCNSVKRVSDLYDAMKEDNFPVCCIHSSMDPDARTKAFNDFISGQFRVLISSNVTARGIDVQQVSVVINFDLPRDTHCYLHRIGRSGRWGRKGVGINFITRRDVPKIKDIEEYYNCEIREFPKDFSNLIH